MSATQEKEASLSLPLDLAQAVESESPPHIAASSSSAAAAWKAAYLCANCSRQGHADNTDPLCPCYARKPEDHPDAEQGTEGRNPHMFEINATALPGGRGFQIENPDYTRGIGVVGAPFTKETNNCLIDSLRQCLFGSIRLGIQM